MLNNNNGGFTKTKPIVLFSTRGGNTEKVANELVHELNCKCVKVAKDSNPSAINLTDYDLLFVGTGIYAGKPNKDMLNYLKDANFKKHVHFAVFITWYGVKGSDEKIFNKIKTVLEGKEQKVLDGYYKCYGEGHSSFERGFASFMGSSALGHPDSSDLSAARKWAREIIAVLQN